MVKNLNQPKNRLVGVNESGRRVGQDHPKAVLTDRDVALLFELRSMGWGYKRIARKLEVGRTLVRSIIKGRTRCQPPTRFKRV